MRRLITLVPAAVAAAGAFVWHTGYAAPLLYGARRWWAARPETEDDPVG